jgi:hypothetical protein
VRDPENRAAESVPFAANIFFIQIGKKSVISAWALTSTGRLGRATATQTTSALTPRVQFLLPRATATGPSPRGRRPAAIIYPRGIQGSGRLVKQCALPSLAHSALLLGMIGDSVANVATTLQGILDRETLREGKDGE